MSKSVTLHMTVTDAFLLFVLSRNGGSDTAAAERHRRPCARCQHQPFRPAMAQLISDGCRPARARRCALISSRPSCTRTATTKPCEPCACTCISPLSMFFSHVWCPPQCPLPLLMAGGSSSARRTPTSSHHLHPRRVPPRLPAGAALHGMVTETIGTWSRRR